MESKMTYEECKDTIARRNNQPTWKKLLSASYSKERLERLHDQVADLYAKSKWDEACNSQLEMIAVGFRDNMNMAERDSDKAVFQAISETITRFPKPVFV